MQVLPGVTTYVVIKIPSDEKLFKGVTINVSTRVWAFFSSYKK